MMTELSIRFTSDETTEDSPITVSLFRPDTGTIIDPAPFTPPLDDTVLTDLHWYLERFSTWPTGPDYEHAGRIEANMEPWGRALLQSVLTDEASRLWQQFVDADEDGKLVTIDATDPRVLRLPWELLADEGGHIFTQQIGVRRRLPKTQSSAVKPFALPVRILVVVARPDDAGFIDPRAVSKPLLAALQPLGERVDVEFLYPPTLKALTDRLRKRNAPPVHVVHFDGHGVYDANKGLGYLLFENESYKDDLVDADRLGTLLNRRGVPLMVLNACQSAKQEKSNPYASVAARLIRAGVGSVLAMNYSVLVVAARKFVQAFYGGLADGLSVGKAVDEGRYTLLADEERHSITRRNHDGDLVEETIRLRDWFLPALYQQADDPVVFSLGSPASCRPTDGTSVSVSPESSILPADLQHQIVEFLTFLPGFDDLNSRRALLQSAGFDPELLSRIDASGAPLPFFERLVPMLFGYGALRDGRNALAAVLETAKTYVGSDKQAICETLILAIQKSPHPDPLPEGEGENLPSPLRRGAGGEVSSPGQLPPEPRHGFHGRARELLKLERGFAKHDIIMLHGFGGLGKTALAAEAGRWFQRIGRFPGGAAFVSFEQGGSLQQLCSWVGQAVSKNPDFMIGDGNPVERVAALLQQRPALVVLDNFESVLGRDPLMPPEELQEVLNAVWSWATSPPAPLQKRGETPSPSGRVGEGSSKILITTRNTSISDDRFSPSKHCAHIGLEGLVKHEALELAAAILEDYGIDRSTVPREELEQLMERLGGHPLSLYLVLPHLRNFSPSELSTQFESLLPGFINGAAQERNESLTVSLEFSLRRLGEDTRKALPALAVFQGGTLESELLKITQIDPELWKTARAELEQAALVSVESIPGVEPPFLQFHPTLVPYLAARLTPERRAGLEQRYWQRYYALSNYLYNADTQTPHQARAIAQREMPNLLRAFELAVAETLTPGPLRQAQNTASPKGRGEEEKDAEAPSQQPNSSGLSFEPDALASDFLPSPSGRGAGGEGLEVAAKAVRFADNIARFLDYFGRWRERDRLLQKLEGLQVSGDEGLTKAEFMMLDQRGDVLLQQGRAAQAEQLFRDLLARLESGTAYDAEYDRGTTLARLGRCLAAQGQPTQAIAQHQQALAVFERLSASNDNAKEMLGKVYTDLGDNLANTGQFDNAQKAYENGLKVSKEIGDHRSVGVKFGQLGTLAMLRRDLPEAARRYTEALETFRAIGEPQSEAVAWHQLGMVAEEASEWDEAERCYRESLKLDEQMNDLQGAAQTCNQLAIVAEGAGRLEDAERWYLRTIEYADYLHDQGAGVYNNLADLYLTQNRLDEAEQYALKAVTIKEQLDLSASPWTTYNILAQIVIKQGRTREAAQWRRKEQDSYAAYAGFSQSVQQWQQELAVIAAACQGHVEAQETTEQILAQYQDSDDWGVLAQTFRRILDGERDLEALRSELRGDHFVIVRTLLAQLAGETAPEPEAQEEGLSLDKLLQLVKQACGPNAPAGLREQLQEMTQQLANDANAPAKIRALGQALSALLSGAAPDLAGLPPQFAEMLRNVMSQS